MSTTTQGTPVSQHGADSLWKTSTRLFLGIACIAVLADDRSIAGGASDEYCRKFHQECVDARAQGYRDVGICNVERLECESGRGSRATRGEREAAPTVDPPTERFSPAASDEARSVR